jgi:hypothetical protein
MGISAQQVVDINSTETEITSQQATDVVQIYFKIGIPMLWLPNTAVLANTIKLESVRSKR